MKSGNAETWKSHLLFIFNPLFVLMYICLGIGIFIMASERRDQAAYQVNVEATAGEVSGVMRKIEFNSMNGESATVKAFIRKSDGTYVWTRIRGEMAKAVLARFDEDRGLNVKVTVGGNGVVEAMDFKQG